MNKPRRIERPSTEALRRVRAIADRQLTPEEFDAYVHAPMSDEERDEILASVAWFTRRYPTAGERLAASRRAYARWTPSRND